MILTLKFVLFTLQFDKQARTECIKPDQVLDSVVSDQDLSHLPFIQQFWPYQQVF